MNNLANYIKLQQLNAKKLVCKNCKRNFQTSRKHRGKLYCSRECWKIHWKGENTHMFGRIGFTKDKKMSDEQKLKISLSKKGSIAWNKGIKYSAISKEKHWNWKGGITSLHHHLRGSLDWKRWRKEVYERDGYRCVDCGERQELEPHHILPVREQKFRSKLFDLKNGITLCRRCHQKTFWKEEELARTYFSLLPC